MISADLTLNFTIMVIIREDIFQADVMGTSFHTWFGPEQPFQVNGTFIQLTLIYSKHV